MYKLSIYQAAIQFAAARMLWEGKYLYQPWGLSYPEPIPFSSWLLGANNLLCKPFGLRGLPRAMQLLSKMLVLLPPCGCAAQNQQPFQQRCPTVASMRTNHELSRLFWFWWSDFNLSICKCSTSNYMFRKKKPQRFIRWNCHFICWSLLWIMYFCISLFPCWKEVIKIFL